MGTTQNALKGNITMLLDNPFTKDARVMKEVETLVSSGYHIHIVALAEPGLPEIEKHVSYTIHRQLNNIPFKPFHTEYPSKTRKWAEYALSLSPTIIHCHDFYTLPVGYKIKQRDQEIKLIYDSHEYWRGISFLGRVSGFLNKIKNTLVFAYFLSKEFQIIKHCDAIIGASELIANKLKPQNSNIPVLPLPNFPAKMVEIKDHFEDNHVLTLCACGNIYVGIEVFKNLLLALKETGIPARLVLINDREQGQEYYKKLIHEYASSGVSIELWPYPDEETLLQQMMSMDFGLQLLDIRSNSQKITSCNRFNIYINAGVPIISDPTEEVYAVNKITRSVLIIKDHGVASFKTIFQEALENKLALKSAAKKHINKFVWNQNEELQKLYTTLQNKRP